MSPSEHRPQPSRVFACHLMRFPAYLQILEINHRFPPWIGLQNSDRPSKLAAQDSSLISSSQNSFPAFGVTLPQSSSRTSLRRSLRRKALTPASPQVR